MYIESWFDSELQILTEIGQTTKSRPEVGWRKLQIFNVYFSVQQYPDFDWFRQFLSGRDTISQFSWISHDINVKILWLGRGIHQELTSVEWFEKYLIRYLRNRYMVIAIHNMGRTVLNTVHTQSQYTVLKFSDHKYHMYVSLISNLTQSTFWFSSYNIFVLSTKLLFSVEFTENSQKIKFSQ